MLKVTVPQADINSDLLTQYNLPALPNGTETEISGRLVLLFEDEEEAVSYLDKLEDFATELDANAPEKHLINALAIAINNDEFVQAYLR